MSEENNVVDDVVEQPVDIAEPNKDEAANKCILKYAAGSMAVGFIPIPLVDIVALNGIQLKLLHSLSKIYGVNFKEDLTKSAITTLVGSIAPVTMTAPLASSLAKFVPFVGTALSYGSLPVLGGASTYAVGNVFKQHFASGGTFLTFDPEAVREYFAEQFEEGKDVVSALREKKTKEGAKVKPVDVAT